MRPIIPTGGIGTFGGGLNRINRKTGELTAYQFDPNNPLGISSDKFYYLIRDEAGILWSATSSDGLNRKDSLTGEFTVYKYTDVQPDVISSNFLTTIEPVGKVPFVGLHVGIRVGFI